jgi:hypothetical protein
MVVSMGKFDPFAIELLQDLPVRKATGKRHFDVREPKPYAAGG